jgi:DNA-binding transcriptional MerR regulator
MESAAMSIDELSIAAGLSRRAVRYYVQQKLLSPPNGLGRGSRYDASHLNQLRRIAELQTAGHSLDCIRTILAGGDVPAQSHATLRPRRRAALSAELWTRIALADGVEIHFDAGRHQPDLKDLLALKELAERVFVKEETDHPEG